MKDPDRKVTYLRKYGQDFHQYYTRTLQSIPELQQNLYKVSIKYGPRATEYFLTERIVFSESEIETENEGQIKESTKLIVPPNAQIYVNEKGLYDLKEI